MSVDEQFILGLIDGGALVVDGEGRIWRHATRSRTSRVLPIQPARADHPTPDGYHSIRASADGRGAAGEGPVSLARAFGVTRRSIRLILTGRTWQNEYPTSHPIGATA